MPIRIFISHSAADENLAHALVDGLMSCMMLADEDIRCTSVAGHKLDVGVETSAVLRDELEETSVVVGLLTPNAIASSWVLFELGATWGAKRKIKPLLAGPLTFKDLPGPLSSHHAVKLSDKNGLVQVVEEIAKITQVPKRGGSKIDSALDKLVKAARDFEKRLDRAKTKDKTEPSEPSFGRWSFSELMNILSHEKIDVPSGLFGSDAPSTTTLFSAFLSNTRAFAGGLASNASPKTSSGFLFQYVGLRLVPFQLVEFEKLTAEQAKYFKRLVLSSSGQNFVAHCKHLLATGGLSKQPR